MPDLPRPVQAQMDDLRKQYQSLDILVNKLKSLSGGTLAVQQELVRNAREESKALESKIEDIRVLADEQDKETDRILIIAMLGKIEIQFKQQQQSLRQAILTSKQNIDREAVSERELLLGGSKSAKELQELRRRGKSGDTNEHLLNTSREQNESLNRTLQLMQQEVERTSHSAKLIDESSKTLQSTVKEYHTYDEVLKRGKNLISKLSQADWMDRLLIGFGLLLFSLVVLYILKKRVADRGITLTGYLFMPLRWMLSLLMPSLNTPPSSAPIATVSEILKEVAPKPILDPAAEQIKEQIGTAFGKHIEFILSTATQTAAPTMSAVPTSQGFFSVLNVLVGE